MNEEINYQELKKGFFWKVKEKDKSLFYDHMANLMDWWVSITDSLSSFVDKTWNDNLARYINNLSFFVNKWDSLSLWMKKIPALFDKQEISLIEAWESTGNLVESLYSVSKLIEEKDELRRRIKWALTYPSIIFVFLIIAIVVVMIFVVPRLMTMFNETWLDLPISTKMLIASSNFFKSNILIIVFLVIVWIFWLKAFSETKAWKLALDKIYFKLPIVWDVYKNYALSIIANNLWILMKGWIPLMKVFDLTASSSPSYLYEKALLSVKEKVKTWEKIWKSMEDVDPEKAFFKKDFIQMISVWEKTSTVDKVSIKLAKYYSSEVKSSLSILLKWIEPIAILISWIFVVWFALAIFSAILQLSNITI